MDVPFASGELCLLDGQREDLPIVLNKPKCVVAYSTGVGKTVIGLSVAAFIKSKLPTYPVILITKSSLIKQWASEFKRFFISKPGAFSLVLAFGDQSSRALAWEKMNNPGVLILTSYGVLAKDTDMIANVLSSVGNFCVVFDEASIFKSRNSEINEVLCNLFGKATRSIALDATPITESLEDMYGIFKVIDSSVFGTYDRFASQFLIRKRIKPWVEITVGFRNVDRFKEIVSPYIVRRVKTDLTTKLPLLNEEYIWVDLTETQKVELERIFKTDDSVMVNSIHAQILCDCPNVYYKGDGYANPKLEALRAYVDKFKDDSILVFCQYRTIIDNIINLFEGAGRITGAETYTNRERTKDEFNNGNIKVLFITRAAIRGINLHGAKRLVFYDSIFSMGDQIQIIGRMHRLRSTYDQVYATYLIARGSADEYIYKILAKKSDLIMDIFNGKVDHPVYKSLTVRASSIVNFMKRKYSPVSVQL